MQVSSTINIFSLSLLLLFFNLSSMDAVIIDFEGIAPVGTQTTEDNTINIFSGFNVFVFHGHYEDSALNLIINGLASR